MKKLLIAASALTTRNYFSLFNMKATPTGTVYTAGQVKDLLIPTEQQAGNAFAALPANLPAFQLVQFQTPVNLGGGAPQDRGGRARADRHGVPVRGVRLGS